jgi:hypothetical protein
LSDLGALVEDEFAAISAATTDELTGLLTGAGLINSLILRFPLPAAVQSR